MNQLVKSRRISWSEDAVVVKKAVCVGLHPGTVKTGLSEGVLEEYKGGEVVQSGVCECEVAVRWCKGLGEEGRGKCWDWEGKEDSTLMYALEERICGASCGCARGCRK